MKSLSQKNKSKIFIILYCFLISFIILLFTSKCSFFYPFNDWVDANAFFTVGKSMFHNIVPYRDLFEQKGPFIYFIYALASLISSTSFIGVFIFEVIFWTIALYYAYKIITLFLSPKHALIIIPIFCTLLCTSRAFVHGGGAEEFCLPLFMITLYYYLSFFKNKSLEVKQLIIAGICASLILLTKYTLIGFWFAFMATIFFNLFFQKKYRTSIIYCLYFLLGMSIPLLLAFIYLIKNHALNDFINVYFKTNLNAYNRPSTNPLLKPFQIYGGFVGSCASSGLFEIILVVLFPFFLWFLPLKKDAKISLLITYFITILSVFFGLRFYKYYLFPLLVFMLLSLLALFYLISKHISKSISKVSKYYVSFLVLIIFCTTLYAFGNANYKEERFQKKEDLFQYKFAKIMSEEPNPTLVNMGYVDCGLYTMANIYPTTYFFEQQNISYKNFPDNLDSFKTYIKNQTTTFIVYFTKIDLDHLKAKAPDLFTYYSLIAREKVKYDHKNFNAYLFKKTN